MVIDPNKVNLGYSASQLACPPQSRPPDISMAGMRDFLTPHVEKRLAEANVHDPGIIFYVAELLERASYGRESANPLFYGEKLGLLIQMRAGCEDLLRRNAFNKDIGDYALLTAGLFSSDSRDPQLYSYVGSDAYSGYSRYIGAMRQKATSDLFYAMALCFGNCVRALNTMREEDIVIDVDTSYNLLLVPKDRKILENLMLDALTRSKITGKKEDRKTALFYTERLGISPDELFKTV